MNHSELFLSALDETADKFFFQTFDDSAKKDPKLVRTNFCPFSDAVQVLRDLNQAGAGIFVCINRLKKGATRSNENIESIRAVFVDLDGSPVQPVLECGLEPHMIINSGGGDDHYHAYWLVDDLPVEEFSAIQRALAAQFNADPKVIDPARVMRLPGFRNQKHGSPGGMVYPIEDPAPTLPYSADKIREFAQVDKYRSEKLELKAPSAKTMLSSDDMIPGGVRNDVLFRMACSLRETGLNIRTAGLVIDSVNQARCDPPLPDSELATLIKSAYKYLPGEDGRSFTFDDLGNGRKLVDTYGDVMRHITESKQWALLDTNTCLWSMAEATEVRFMAQQIADRLRTESDVLTKKAAENPALEDMAKAAQKWAKVSRSSGRISSMILEAAAMPEIAVQYDTFDADPMALCVENGVVRLDAAGPRLHKIKPTDYFTKRAAVKFNRKAKCPLWNEFVLQCCNFDYELADYVQRAVGYSLTARTDEQVFFMIIGPGGNGKSTFLEILRKMLGGYGVASDARVFQTRGPDAPTNDIARLAGARMITAPELSTTRRLDDGLVKQIVGGDKIVARQMYKDFFEFAFVGKIWISGNERPDISDISDGIWRRLRLIEFPAKISSEKRDNGLLAKLEAELEGILLWAIEGCLKWQKDGLREAQAVTAAHDSYREDNDSVEQWIAYCVEESPGSKVNMGALQTSYFAWCRETGTPAKQMNQFRRSVRDKFQFGTHARVAWAKNIRLRPNLARFART